jgi:predicted  nucleic acid-binding Zn-ribbon protein
MLDLHVHTPASRCYSRQDDTAEQIVQAAIDRNLTGIAVTDHNSADWIDAVKKAARGTPLVVFPGVEITTAQRFHVVALFDPTADQRQIESFLGAIDITPSDFGRSESFCSKSTEELLATIHRRGGLAVLAHIDQPRGAFHELTERGSEGKLRVPVTCYQFLNSARYDAVECTSGDYPECYDALHHITRFPALYQASDNPDADSPSKHACTGIGNAYTWFKVESVDLEGLRQCFSDPEVRIQLVDEYSEMAYPRIVSMSVGNAGFLAGQRFEFHRGLNSIIGGKGVGKSLAVEFLRFALNQASTNKDLRDDHIRKLDARLTPGNFVDVEYQTGDGTQYRIRKTYRGYDRTDDGLAIHEETECTNLTTFSQYTGDIPRVLPVLAYSQSEVIRIAEDTGAQLRLIDGFIDTRQPEAQIQRIQQALTDSDQRLAKAIQARDQLTSVEGQIATLEEQITAIDRQLSDPIFEQMKLAENKLGTFGAQIEFIDDLTESVHAWQAHVDGLVLTPLPEILSDDMDLQTQRSVAATARDSTLEALEALCSTLIAWRAAASECLSNWQPTYESIRAGYDSFLRSIGTTQKEQEAERQRLLRQRDQLNTHASSLRAAGAELESLISARQDMLSELDHAHYSYFELRRAKYDELSALSDGKLRLELAHAQNRAAFEERLVDMLRGGSNSISLADRRRISQQVTPDRLGQLLIARDGNALAAEAGITQLWADRAIERLWSHDEFADVLALQHNSYPEDTPRILVQKGNDNYDELGNLSVGQKCTALLIIALCDGTMPVLIDQPEDALDIVSVWEDISKKLRRGKNHRQFVLTTHNSSVAVAADSDQFIVLTGGADRGQVAASGAIDQERVRSAVIAHLEGGDEPYRLRAAKYNLIPSSS